MASSAPAPVVVQKFKPSGGSLIAYLSIAAFGAFSVLAVASGPSLFALRVVLGMGLLILLTWTTLLRPRADATPETLRLRNLLSDHHVPLARVDEVMVGQMLLVWVGQDRYACVGIGRPVRQRAGRRPMAVLGAEQADRMGMGEAGESGAAVNYADFVENRISDLARSARRDFRTPSPGVRRVWAWPEIIAIVVVGVGFVVSLMV